MDEFLRFLLISNISLLVVWLSYNLLMFGNTFHALNRVYLILGSAISLLLPFLPTAKTASTLVQGIQLPEFIVGGNMEDALSIRDSNSWMLYLYIIGVLVAFSLFFRGISKMIALFKKSVSEIVQGEWVLRSELAGPFSFLSVIHLPKKLSEEHAKTILKHELAHVRLGHSYDVLWLSLLRILFWFNPLMTIYLRTLQEIHEYQADARTHISTNKEHYVKIQLHQLFQLPSELSAANGFFNSINLKKRINMIYSKETS
ncbi:MAG: M56 family metallopeptidase, partial [Flavobacteriales bacterium]|nr:M56 family metallopeptidase [Flavobacteriales bacterium]